jgi:ATP-dependent exoDNAse (exonuclease V) beta subunit
VTPVAAPPEPRRGATGPAFTAEQRAAIADREGSRLLSANAGSGKTAVMVERFVEAVLDDGVAVGAILALTFTEKAAGELRERVRRRFSELGRDDLARDAEAAWVGTIHGFCARVLRTHPLAAGLDPGFGVLDEPTAQRASAAAFERALDAFVARRGEAAVDLAAAYGPALRDLVLRAHAALRSRGASPPRLRVPPAAPAPDPSGLAAARAAAAAHLAVVAKPGVRVSEAIAALAACETALAGAGGAVPLPGGLDAGKVGSSAAVLKEEPCAAYRAAWEAYRQGCADHHARAALELIAELLEGFDEAYTAAKRARAAVDFEDLELGVRDLFAREPALRRRWAERFALIMVDEFQDTNRLQLDVLEGLERDNLFAVGDEFQSIYGFRHADVTIFRGRRAQLGPEGTRSLRANFRSSEELLDVLNGAFAAEFGAAFAPLAAGRAAAPPVDDGPALRLFDPDRGLRPSSCWSRTPRAGRSAPSRSRRWASRRSPISRGGGPRRARSPTACARRSTEGRREGDIVVLVRATASLRLLEQALEEEGLATYVVGGRGYWAQEQVRDGLAYLRALANPLDEEALLGVLASPFAGASADALVLLAREGRGAGGLWAALRAAAEAGEAGVLAPVGAGERERLARFARLFAGERLRAQRLAAEVLLERAITATGYDLATLARADGERRLANVRKLMRLAREYERAEGRDLRGFLGFAATQELEAAREGEAPLEGEGLNAIRLMTIHRAKGLEFPWSASPTSGVRRLARATRCCWVPTGGRACGSPPSAARATCPRSPTTSCRRPSRRRRARRSGGCSTWR